MFGTKPADLNGLRWFTPLDAPPTSVAQPNVTPIAATDVPVAPRPGFFGKGGVGRAIVGNIADGILQTMGQQPTYRLAMEHQRDLEEQRQQALANLGDQLQLWQAQQRFKAQNPAPTALMTNYEWLKGINPGAAQSYLDTQTTAPPLVQHNADGTSTIYPAGSIPRVSTPQRPAIGTVIDELPEGGDPASMGASDDQGAAILSGAAQSGTITPQQDAIMRSSFGSNGQSAYRAWLAKNNIRVSN